MFYSGLRRGRWRGTEAERKRCIDGLVKIRQRFENADAAWRTVETTGTLVGGSGHRGGI